MTLKSINGIIKENPEQAADLIRNWLSDDQGNTDCEVIQNYTECENIQDYTDRDYIQVYTNSEKAAVLMASVNFETANKIYHYLRKGEIKKIAMKAKQLEKNTMKAVQFKRIDENEYDRKLQKLIDLKKINSVLLEFNKKLEVKLSNKKGGADYASKLLGTRKP